MTRSKAPVELVEAKYIAARMLAMPPQPTQKAKRSPAKRSARKGRARAGKASRGILTLD